MRHVNQRDALRAAAVLLGRAIPNTRAPDRPMPVRKG
jgi:hypothetical protein